MAKNIVREIRKASRRKFSAEEKIRIVLEGLRGEIGKMSPDEAARAFFDACGKEDWKEVGKFLPFSPHPRVYLAVLEVISIGTPFQSGPFPEHWFVPYEIKLKSGRIKKHNLALKKDKVAKRFIVDGGY